MHAVMKKVRARRKAATTIDSLPQDLIVKIVLHLMSSSQTPVSTLDCLRKTCRAFRAASKARIVGKHMPVAEDWNLLWRDRARYFAILERCAEAGNAEASFVLGLDEALNRGKLRKGFLHLEKAIDEGHEAAMYTLGIMLFDKEESRCRGMELLNLVDSRHHIEQCRRKVFSVMWNIIMRRWRSVGARERCVNETCGRHRVRREDREYEIIFCSPLCKWKHEYHNFKVYI